MKKVLLPVVWMGWFLALGPAAAPAATSPAATTPSDVILRFHFVGLNLLLADTNAAKLKQIWSLPATADLLKQAFDQLARVPFQAISNEAARGLPDQSALIRPLLEDLLPGESYLDWRGPAGQPAECVLALQLADDRARLWRDNLRQAVERWKLGTISEAKADGTEGWVLNHRDGKSAFAWGRAGQWVVVGLGPAGLPLHAQVLQQIKAGGRPGPRPSGHWLVADVNLERLKPWLPPLAPYAHPPLAHLTVSNRADDVRTTMDLQFPNGHGWKSEPWNIPTNLIRDPVISFTAAQGVAPLLQGWKFFRQLGFSPIPDQLVLWANAAAPFLSQVALPIRNGRQELGRLTPLLQTMISTQKSLAIPVKIGWDTNAHALLWRGLPVALPELQAVKIRDAEYLVGGLFPRLSSTNLAPADLFNQVRSRSDLAYYHWEITESRLRQWRPLYQLADIITGRTFVLTNAPSQRWLLSVAPLLGNTITEITVHSPTRMTLARKSHCGLTGFELVSLTRWLDSPEFPECSVIGHEKRPIVPRKEKPKLR